MITILMVEDDPNLARGMQINLEIEGYRFLHADSVQKAKSINDQEALHLVLLDLGLPDGSGFDFLRMLRDSGSRLPVIILTAQSDEDSVVNGLQIGANDYVKKPFSQKELLARIKSVLREPSQREEQIRFGDMLLLLETRSVQFKGQALELNRREFDILHFFVSRAEKIVTRESLLQSLDKDGEIFDRTIDSHVSHLRGKLKKAGVHGVGISSVYGVGYRLEKLNEK